MMKLLPEKDYEEIVTVTFEFSADLGVGETINTPVTACSVQSGEDASPANVLNGAPTISGSDVLQSVKAGVVGVNYYLRAKVQTSLARTLVLGVVLPVRKSGLG